MPDLGTFRGITAELDGKVVGVAGVLHGAELQAFSTIDFDASRNKRFVAKGIREYRKILKSYSIPVYARANSDKATAHSFLRHMGFEEIGNGIYKWTPHQ